MKVMTFVAVAAVAVGGAVAVGCAGTACAKGSCEKTLAAKAGFTIPGEKCVIVSSFRAPAQELKQHLDFITGLKVPVYDPKQAEKKLKGDEYVWYVGVAPDDKKDEKLVAESGRYRVTPKGAWIWGGPCHGEERGGLYPMLEEALGVRWPWVGAIAVPHQGPDIYVYQTEGGWKPPFWVRALRMGRDKESIAWRERMRVSGGGSNRPAYGHAFSQFWERFGWNKQHPEYFAQRKDGQRMPMNVSPDTAYNVAASKDKPARFISMCVSSEAFIDQVVADWKEAGAGNWINLCENDAQGDSICFCPNCLKLDEPMPANANPEWKTWYADRYIHFCHAVLAKAKKINPNVRATTYAYNAMECPPRRERVNNDICVGIVPTVFTKEAVRDFVKGWKDAGMKEYFHRPNRRCYYAPPVFPVGFERHFYDIFRIIYDAGDCVGFDHDGGTPETVFGSFSDYVIAKTMQDPTKSFEHWESHYFDAFGPAKDEIREYFRYWREEVWEKRLEKDILKLTVRGLAFNFIRGLIWNLDQYYFPSDFEKTGEILADAAKRTDLNASQKALVDQLVSTHEYARLWVRAVVERDEDNTKALMEYRRANKFGVLPRNEKYWGDLCGVMRWLLPTPKQFHSKASDYCIVDCGYPEPAAELKKHMSWQLSYDIPVVKGEAAAPTNTFNLYVGRIPHGADPRLTEFQPAEEGYWIFPAKGKQKTAYFYGPDAKAVANAVHDFLEFELGARWPWEDEVAMKKRPELGVYTWKNAWHPYLRLAKRSVTFKDEPKSAVFASRHRNGAHVIKADNPYGIPTNAKAVKVEKAFRVGGEKEAFDEWQASYNENESFAYEYVLPKPKTVFDWHVAYILDKAMSDPYKSFGYWENHYLQSFGAAAREMRQFFTALRERKDGSKFLEAALGRADLEPEDRARVERVKADYAKVR